MPDTKAEWRTHCKKVWRSFLEGSGPDALRQNLGEHLRESLTPATRILVTLPLPDELDYLSVLPPVQLYAPVTEPGGQMTFRKLSRNAEGFRIEKGHRGIPGPSQDALPLALPLGSADIAIVPALGTTETGHRLGRGGGYYDRWANRLDVAQTISLVPENLSRLGFEPEAHDLRCRCVITERFIRFT